MPKIEIKHDGLWVYSFNEKASLAPAEGGYGGTHHAGSLDDEPSFSLKINMVGEKREAASEELLADALMRMLHWVLPTSVPPMLTQEQVQELELCPRARQAARSARQRREFSYAKMRYTNAKEAYIKHRATGSSQELLPLLGLVAASHYDELIELTERRDAKRERKQRSRTARLLLLLFCERLSPEQIAASLLSIRELPLMLEAAKTELLCESIGVDHFCRNVLRKVAMTLTDLPVLELFDKWAATFEYQSLHTDLASHIRAIKSKALPPAHHGYWAGRKNVQAMAQTNTLVNELLALKTRGLSTMLEAAKTRLLAQELGQGRFLDKVLGKIALSRDDVPVLSSFQDWAAKQQRPPLMSVANRLAGKIRSLERL